MVPSSLIYTNNAGSSIALTTGAVTDSYPLQNFTMTVNHRNSAVSKTQAPGQWPTYSYPDYRTIFCGGSILGTDASDYNTKVAALKNVVQVPYRYLTSRRHGYLSMVFYGDGNTYYINVILQTIETPKEANYPSVGTYEINWTSFEPYLRVGSPAGAVSLNY